MSRAYLFKNMEQTKKIARPVLMVCGVLLALYALCIAARVFMNRDQLRPLAEYNQAVSAFQREAARDSYGGTSPQETVELFKAALERGEIAHAAKYFVREEASGDEKWRRALERLQAAGGLPDLIEKVGRLQPDEDGIIGNTLYTYAVRSGTGEVIMSMRLFFNGYRWKITSL
jgi:hypothetical protein